MRIRRIITTSEGGVSRPPYASFNLGAHVGDDPGAVAANRARLDGELGLGGRVVWMEQIHGRTATVVHEPRDEPVEASDALVTAEPGLAVAALVADCVPILLGDPAAGVVAAVHAGRVGAAAGVLVQAVKAMRGLGAEPERTEALLGPAVCGSCYEVPRELRAQVQQRLPGSESTTRSGTPGLDLRAGLRVQLAGLGVGKVGTDPRCTFEDPTLFSHRRQAPTGRLAALTWCSHD